MSGIRDRHGPSGALSTSRASLRFPLALPLLIALLALAVLWGYAAVGLTGDALRQRSDADRAGSAGESVQLLVSRLQDERLHTAVWQSAPDGTAREALESARAETDDAVAEFRGARSTVAAGGAAAADRADELAEALDGLTALREAVDAGGAGETEAFTGYTETVSEGTALFAVAVRAGGETGGGAAAVAALLRVEEGLARGEALAHLAGSADGDEADAVGERFALALGSLRESRLALEHRDLPAEQAAAYARLTAGEAWETVTAAEERAGTGRAALPADPAGWAEAAAVAGEELDGLAAAALAKTAADGGAAANRALLGVALGTLVALAALAGAAVLGHRTWKSLSGRMAELEDDTRRLADERLPELTEQLLRAKPEVPADLLPERERTGDELDRVAAATEHQWRRLVETLVTQAQGRAGTETVLLGLARRTQSLINRMIPKLDKLEREHQDSRLLKDIFVVDHLATRVRRHTENLLILGGSLPSRRWGKPVPVYEVIRSAISETEDYSRVEAMPGPAVSLTGRAVADVSHLLAELIENGSSFSPPETKVTVSAQVVAKGRVAIEVMDRGLGMPPAEYERLNNLLADPPKLDITNLGNSPRLGLLVVARLAKRHGLEVVLRRSPYGGTLAVVLLPNALLEQAKPLLPGLIADGVRADGPREDGAPADTAEQPARPQPTPAHAGAPAHAAVASAAGAPDAAGSLSWIGDDGTGYPSYSGAGLVPPGSAEATAQPAEPEHHAPPPPRRHRQQPAPSVPDGLSMVTGGAGLLPPTDAQGGHGAPLASDALGPRDALGGQDGYGARDPLANGGYEHSERPGAPSVPGGSEITAAAMAAARNPDGPGHRDAPDVVHTREVPVSPHSEGVRPGQRGPDGTAGQDATGGPPPEAVRRGDSPLVLPVRVRGENLAEGLRAPQPPLERDGKGLSDAAPSPERAARTIGAIQWGNRRARAAAESHSPGGHDQASAPGHATGSEEPARKDQR